MAARPTAHRIAKARSLAAGGTVRSSRDGDHYHYYRAARLALGMLDLTSDRVAVVVESKAGADRVRGGEDVIDLALYRGSENDAKATAISYRQFKHSTRREYVEWTASGLAGTLVGFAERYAGLARKFGAADVAKRFRFEFETNRPVAAAVTGAIADIAAGRATRRSTYLRRKIPLKGARLRAFAGLVDIIADTPGLYAQRDLLGAGMREVLPDTDRDASIKLKNLVSEKATTLFETNPEIRRHDVLAALDVTEGDLFPAECLIGVPDDLIERAQWRDLASDIAAASGPVIVSADAGVGKSMLAMQIGTLVSGAAATVVFDCFANGSYRSVSKYRHTAHTGPVQIANQLASDGLCDLLIPSNKADDSAHVRAFMARIAQAAAALPEGRLLVVVVDAADNAEAAAVEADSGPAFPRQLLREVWPANARLVLTARPYRIDDLAPPPEVAVLTLAAFDAAETARRLRHIYPGASDIECAEFHRLTSGNPRSQSTAMVTATTLPGVLRALGTVPLTVDATIHRLLEQAVAKVRDTYLGMDQVRLDRICEALATLRPFVPLGIVAAAANVEVPIVRSIAADLDQAFMVLGDAVQFRDEPTETWFRERFKPGNDQLAAFAERLRPLAADSFYVAAIMPQLLLEAGRFDELVELALSDDALPENNPLGRRDVEMQRLNFALRAALKARRYLEATKLAIRAGGETAADDRQQNILNANTDIAGRYLEPEQMLDQVSRHLIGGGSWTGSEHCYEAALLSANPTLGGDASARLRLADGWVRHWSKAARTQAAERARFSEHDIAELLQAELNLNGPAACARYLRTWTPRDLSYLAGHELVERLVDAGRFDEIDALALAAGNNFWLLLAITSALDAVGRRPPRVAVRRTVRLLSHRLIELRDDHSWEREVAPPPALAMVTPMVAAAAELKAVPRRKLARLIARYMPREVPYFIATGEPHQAGERSAYLRAASLRAALSGKTLALEQFIPAAPDDRNAVVRRSSREERNRVEVGLLLRLHQLRADQLLARSGSNSLAQGLAGVRATLQREWQGSRYADGAEDEFARLWIELLVGAQAGDTLWAEFDSWRAGLDNALFTRTLFDIARRAARCGYGQFALDRSYEAVAIVEAERGEAQYLTDELVTAARTVMTVSEADARELFHRAIAMASRIGDENHTRWSGLVELAIAAGRDAVDDPELAYNFSRGAALTYRFVVKDKHFPWERTSAGLTALSPCSVFPILARWADRRFGWDARQLGEGVKLLVDRRALDPVVALALMPFGRSWDWPALLGAALGAAGTSGRTAVVDLFMRYARFAGLSAKEWTAVAALLETETDLIATLAALRAAAEHEEERETSHSRGPSTRRRRRPIDWARLLDGLDPGDPADLVLAAERARKRTKAWAYEGLLPNYAPHVPLGREAAFLRAIPAAGHFSLYDLRSLLEAVPPAWAGRAAIRVELANLVRAMLEEHCTEISLNPWAQRLSLDLASEVTGVAARDFIQLVVDAISRRGGQMGAGDLFNLVGLLGNLTSAEKAREALRYGLRLLEDTIAEDDDDGPWSPDLTPPSEVETGLAGYVWAALASPFAARRWEAAHCVRSLAMLDRSTALFAVADFAKGASVRAFVDRTFRFYDLHAAQWFVIGVARSARESSAAIAPIAAWLRSLADRANPHVLIRHFAAQALIDLHRANALPVDADDPTALATINESLLAPPDNKDLGGRGAAPRDARFTFDYYFQKNIVPAIARPFNLSETDITEAIAAVIRDDWGLPDTGYRDVDERASRGQFQHDRGRPGDDPPEADDLRYYLSYHAAMIATGKLIEVRPANQDTARDYRTLGYWLRSRGLTRADGNWRFDRRDAPPAAPRLRFTVAVARRVMSGRSISLRSSHQRRKRSPFVATIAPIPSSGGSTWI